MLIYDGEFADRTQYDRPFIPGVESNGRAFEARWHGPGSFSRETPLHPHGLPELLRSLATLHTR